MSLSCVGNSYLVIWGCRPLGPGGVRSTGRLCSTRQTWGSRDQQHSSPGEQEGNSWLHPRLQIRLRRGSARLAGRWQHWPSSVARAAQLPRPRDRHGGTLTSSTGSETHAYCTASPTPTPGPTDPHTDKHHLTLTRCEVSDTGASGVGDLAFQRALCMRPRAPRLIHGTGLDKDKGVGSGAAQAEAPYRDRSSLSPRGPGSSPLGSQRACSPHDCRSLWELPRGRRGGQGDTIL